MQVNAVYDHGKIELPGNIQLKHERFHVVVDLPDEEVVHSAAPAFGSEDGIRDRINKILGEYAQLFPTDTPLDTKKEWHKHLERKYMK